MKNIFTTLFITGLITIGGMAHASDNKQSAGSAGSGSSSAAPGTAVLAQGQSGAGAGAAAMHLDYLQAPTKKQQLKLKAQEMLALLGSDSDDEQPSKEAKKESDEIARIKKQAQDSQLKLLADMVAMRSLINTQNDRIANLEQQTGILTQQLQSALQQRDALQQQVNDQQALSGTEAAAAMFS